MNSNIMVVLVTADSVTKNKQANYYKSCKNKTIGKYTTYYFFVEKVLNIFCFKVLLIDENVLS